MSDMAFDEGSCRIRKGLQIKIYKYKKGLILINTLFRYIILYYSITQLLNYSITFFYDVTKVMEVITVIPNQMNRQSYAL
jgi:cytochrome c oxidase subunit IV